MLNFKNKTVVVTGASGGIAEAIVNGFAAQGARLVLIDKNPEVENFAKKLKASGTETIGLVGSITHKSFLIDAAKKANLEFGSIDVLINNAGITKDNFLLNISEEDWDAVIDVNLKGSFLCCQSFFPFMKEKKYGKIVNIISASWMGNPGQCNYAASKGGLVSLTRTLALECARYNVNVNGVSPGLVNTTLVQSIPEDIKNKLIDMRPLKRMGTPEEIANAVIFLASDEAAYITGQILNVDGGKNFG